MTKRARIDDMYPMNFSTRALETELVNLRKTVMEQKDVIERQKKEIDDYEACDMFITELLREGKEKTDDINHLRQDIRDRDYSLRRRLDFMRLRYYTIYNLRCLVEEFVDKNSEFKQLGDDVRDVVSTWQKAELEVNEKKLID